MRACMRCSLLASHGTQPRHVVVVLRLLINEKDWSKIECAIVVYYIYSYIFSKEDI
jgi:hypothetical protein